MDKRLPTLAQQASRNEHTTALVPIETWAYQSPLLRRAGHRLDVGLLAEALVYYDSVVLVPASDVSVARVLREPQANSGDGSPGAVYPPFLDLVARFVHRGEFEDFLSLLGDGTIRIYHYAFRTASIEKDGVFEIWNAVEDPPGQRFRSPRILYHPKLGELIPKARHRERLYRAVEAHLFEGLSPDFEAAVVNAREDMMDGLSAALAVQAFIDDTRELVGALPEKVVVERRVDPGNGRQHLVFNVSFDDVAKAIGPAVGFNAGLVLSGIAHANRSLWSAALSSLDLYLPQPLSRLASVKLVEGNRSARVSGLIERLECEVDFPDVRALVNAGTMSFREALTLRSKAGRFRGWLQNQAERDTDALIAYHHEVALEAGYVRAARKTLRLFGMLAGAAAEPYLGPHLGIGAGVALGVGVQFVADLAASLNEQWRPVVFGDALREYVAERQRKS